jgi:hypothetical protein
MIQDEDDLSELAEEIGDPLIPMEHGLEGGAE